MSRTPYADGLQAYLDRQWPAIIPVHGKSIPVKHATGLDGTVTAEKMTDWQRTHASWNLAIRHQGSVAIDVDQYGEKNGLRSVKAWEKRYGRLRSTWTSTARGADTGSRQHVYRVPEYVVLRSRLRIADEPRDLPDVEVPHFGHRFTTTWPTVHPKLDQQYRWYDPFGAVLDLPPLFDDLPELTATQLEALTAPTRAARIDGAGLSFDELIARSVQVTG